MKKTIKILILILIVILIVGGIGVSIKYFIRSKFSKKLFEIPYLYSMAI